MLFNLRDSAGREASCISFFFFFNDTATTEIYTLSLHDALPICIEDAKVRNQLLDEFNIEIAGGFGSVKGKIRSEEHTSELQSRLHLVCRLLLEKKKILLLMLHSQSISRAYSVALLIPPPSIVVS